MPGVPLHAFDQLEQAFTSFVNQPHRSTPTTTHLPPTPPEEYAQLIGHLTPPKQAAMGLPMTPDVTPPHYLAPPRPPLSHYPSSYADSFRTAQEDLSVNGSTTVLPQLDGASDEYEYPGNPLSHDIGVTQGDWRAASLRKGAKAEEQPRPDTQDSNESWEKHISYISEGDDHERPQPSRPRFHDSHNLRPDTQDSNESWEKHISYISNDDDPDLDFLAGVPSPAPLSPRPVSKSFQLFGEQGNGTVKAPTRSPYKDDQTTFLNSLNVKKQRYRPPTPPEKAMVAKEARDARRLSLLRGEAEREMSHRRSADANDLIYKQIQNFNVERFDALSNGNAVEAVVIPTEAVRNRHLRHVSKRHSLKSSEDGSILAGSRRVSADEGYASLPKQSLDAENSPPKSPQSGREHTLRHPKTRMVPERGNLVKSPELRMIETPRRNVTMPSPAVHSLRREKRPISSVGRPTESSYAPTSLSQASSPQRKLEDSPIIETPSKSLRHVSAPIRLGGDANKMTAMTYDSMSHELRRSSKDYRLENTSGHSRTFSGSTAASDGHDPAFSPTSPRFLGLAARKTNQTPVSVSAVSDRTEMEVCEATNMSIFPHSNNSLLVVQHQGSRPTSKGNSLDTVDSQQAKEVQISGGSRSYHHSPVPNNHLGIPDESLRVSPVFQATVDPPTPPLGSRPEHAVDSPLKNPRQAPPIPPMIKCIPPTPYDERDQDPMTIYDLEGLPQKQERPVPQRRESLAKRARRFSDTVVQPLFSRQPSIRRHQVRRPPSMATEKRDKHLHPFWEPGDIWQDYEDDEDYEPLPRGGDTSEHPQQRRGLFPRNMSVRMPGFRGTGGFLVGNSLGMDRHGSNKRRHYVDLPVDHPLSQRGSREMLSHLSSNSSLRRSAGKDGKKIFSVPGMKGVRVQYVGLKGFKEKMAKRQYDKEEKEREKRRQELRGQIGYRVYHDT